MRVVIVYAHMEPKSFNGAMKDVAIETLTEQGHTVTVSDLYAIGFNPLPSRSDITDELVKPDYFVYDAELSQALGRGTLSKDIQNEIEKLEQCDLVIFQFPLSWGTVPAIMKGWFDRVITAFWVFDFEQSGYKAYGTSRIEGTRAMLSLTTGSPESFFKADGICGDIDATLWPLQYGALRTIGFDVLSPQITYAPGQMTADERHRTLGNWAKRLAKIDSEHPISFLPREAFDPQLGYRLSPEFKLSGNGIREVRNRFAVGHYMCESSKDDNT